MKGIWGSVVPVNVCVNACAHTHMWDVHAYAPQPIIAMGYVLLVVPLVVINLLSMHWLRMLAAKVRAILAKDLSRVQLDAGTAVVALLVALAAAAFERLAASDG